MTSEKNALVPRMEKRVRLVPPDGGWGWMVIFGTALHNIFNQSMLSLFSLLYGEKLEAMGHQTQGAALVLSTMLFVTNFGGPIAGAIIKMTSPRFVAVFGACSCTLGLFFSSFSTNIWHLVMTYGVLLGLGLGFVQNSSFVAINSYFKAKKSRAVGLANAGTGVGQTLMPYLVHYLLNIYGFRNSCLIFSCLSLLGIVGTMLIQPVEKHMIEIIEEVPVTENSQLLDEKHKDIIIRKNSLAKELSSRRSSEPNSIENNRKLSVNNNKDFYNGNKANGVNSQNNNIEEQPLKNKSLLKKVYDLFDLTLLSSPRFVNIILGTALTVTSIQNFSMLFPLFLKNAVKLTEYQVPMCMSAVAGADICGRLTLPILQDKYKIKARWMLIGTCIWLIIIRQILAYQTDLTVMIVCAVLYGYGRSTIIVSRNLAISENCKIEQVPAAVGLGMLSMGLIVPPAGYFLGWIRDATNSYIVCIGAQNMLLVILLLTWIPDMIMETMQEKREKRKETEHLQLT